MPWNALETYWRSQVTGQAFSHAPLPLEVATSTAAYEYALVSELLPPVGIAYAVKVRCQVLRGQMGLCLMKPNGSALLSSEAYIDAADGPTEACFRLDPEYGPAVLMARKVDEADAPSVIRLESVETAPEAALDIDARAGLRGPSDDRAEMLALSPSNIAYAHEPMWPISIGNTCEAKVQIARVLHFRRAPHASQAAFRLMMLPPTRSEDRFGWDLFDWQGTPFASVAAYLRQDFRGLYERDDLEPRPKGVVNRLLDVEHMHDYEHLKTKAATAFTDAMVDRGYAEARARFDRQAEDFRRRLTSPGPFLYVHVCEDIPHEFLVRKMIRLLGERSPDHRFHLLFVGFADEDSDLSALSDQVSKAYRPRPPETVGTDWEGDYAAWDKALAPFKLMLPFETPEDLVPPAQPTATPTLAQRPGFLARLRGRKSAGAAP